MSTRVEGIEKETVNVCKGPCPNFATNIKRIQAT